MRNKSMTKGEIINFALRVPIGLCMDFNKLCFCCWVWSVWATVYNVFYISLYIAIIRAYICYLSVGELVYCELVYYNVYMIKKVEDLKDLKVNLQPLHNL